MLSTSLAIFGVAMICLCLMGWSESLNPAYPPAFRFRFRIGAIGFTLLLAFGCLRILTSYWSGSHERFYLGTASNESDTTAYAIGILAICVIFLTISLIRLTRSRR